MILFCGHCNGGLEQTGRVNCFACLSCQCIYEVRFEMVEVSGPSSYADDLRKYQFAKTPAELPSGPTEDSSLNRSSTSR